MNPLVYFCFIGVLSATFLFGNVDFLHGCHNYEVSETL
jgi:hypothetical protein